MQIPFVGFQPIRTSEHMASAGEICYHLCIPKLCFYCIVANLLHAFFNFIKGALNPNILNLINRKIFALETFWSYFL